MAIECWFNSETQNDSSGSNQFKARQKRRLPIELVAQWFLPIVSVVILHQLTPNNMIAKVSYQEISNDTCEMISLFPSGMPKECYNEANSTEDHQHANNLTISVVQRIYELINGSVTELRDGTNSHALSQPQTQEEWKNMFMHLQMEPGQEYKRKGKQNAIPTFCNEDCELYYKIVQTYFSGLITLTYLLSMAGTVMLHHSTAKRRKHRKDRSIEERHQQHDALANKTVCHLKEVKMMVLSNFITWTPSIIEKFFKKWLCTNPPQWVLAIIFIMGQLSTVIRGLMNAHMSHPDKHQNNNVIVPLNASLDNYLREPIDQTNKNTEVLFEKRA